MKRPPEAGGLDVRVRALWGLTGGEGGIRTPDTLASMPHFECGAFNHSATSPRIVVGHSARALDSGRMGSLQGQNASGQRLHFCRNGELASKECAGRTSLPDSPANLQILQHYPKSRIPSATLSRSPTWPSLSARSLRTRPACPERALQPRHALYGPARIDASKPAGTESKRCHDISLTAARLCPYEPDNFFGRALGRAFPLGPAGPPIDRPDQ